MRASDWSRQSLLRSDWLGPSVAPITTNSIETRFQSWNVFEDVHLTRSTCFIGSKITCLRLMIKPNKTLLLIY